MNNEEIIKSIKNDFRLGMNGVISTSLRNKGMDYKIIFGLSLPQLRRLAEKYQQNKEVASKLWNENIRESKLLASMIYPYNEMDIEEAKRWIEDIRYPEVADISTMFLFSKLPYAEQLCLDYAKSKDESKIYFALRLFIRLLINRVTISSKAIDDIKKIAQEYVNSNISSISLIANDIIIRTESL